MDSDLAKFVRKYEQKVKEIARRMHVLYGWRMPVEDLEQLGHLGLLRAHDTYDPSRGPLEAWASKHIEGQMRTGARTERRQNRVQRTSAAVAAGGHKWIDPEALKTTAAATLNEEMIAFVLLEAEKAGGSSPEEELLDQEAKDRLPELLSQLPERERQCIEMYYYQRMNIPQIATAWGRHPSRVSRVLAHAVETLRGML